MFPLDALKNLESFSGDSEIQDNFKDGAVENSRLYDSKNENLSESKKTKESFDQKSIQSDQVDPENIFGLKQFEGKEVLENGVIYLDDDRSDYKNEPAVKKPEDSWENNLSDENFSEELVAKQSPNSFPGPEVESQEWPNLDTDRYNALKLREENSIDSLIRNALQLMHTGDYQSANESLKKIVSKDPDHVDGNFYLGLSYMGMNQPALAKLYFYSVIKNKSTPDSLMSKSYTELAKIELKSNFPGFALSNLGDALSFDSSNKEAQSLNKSLLHNMKSKSNFIYDWE